MEGVLENRGPYEDLVQWHRSFSMFTLTASVQISIILHRYSAQSSVITCFIHNCHALPA